MIMKTKINLLLVFLAVVALQEGACRSKARQKLSRRQLKNSADEGRIFTALLAAKLGQQFGPVVPQNPILPVSSTPGTSPASTLLGVSSVLPGATGAGTGAATSATSGAATAPATSGGATAPATSGAATAPATSGGATAPATSGGATASSATAPSSDDPEFGEDGILLRNQVQEDCKTGADLEQQLFREYTSLLKQIRRIYSPQRKVRTRKPVQRHNRRGISRDTRKTQL